MQRYRPSIVEAGKLGGMDWAECKPDADGDYVLYADAQARVAELEEALRRFTEAAYPFINYFDKHVAMTAPTEALVASLKYAITDARKSLVGEGDYL